jgi:hypothetical protein
MISWSSRAEPKILSREKMQKRQRPVNSDRPIKKAARFDDGGGSFGSVLRAALEQPLPKTSTTPIMARAKPNPEKLKQLEEEKASKEAAKIVVAKHKWFEKEHIVPDIADANYEKMLLKLATKGVVKLFNAVQTQQQQRLEEKGNDVVAPKPDKLTKGQFLDMLKGGGQSGQESGTAKQTTSKRKVGPIAATNSILICECPTRSGPQIDQ